MPKNNHTKIREYLRTNEDGATIKELEQAFSLQENSVRGALLAMPDVYIDRWQAAGRGQYAAVWCVVVPPADCPKPEARRA